MNDAMAIDAIVNLTPAPQHLRVSEEALGFGLPVYTEKPLAGSLEEALRLAEKARSRDLLLMSAPAVMTTGRFRWLAELLASGRVGRPTLAVAQASSLGPASLRGYNGDPSVFYTRGVGPLVDLGVYALHAVTGLLGPAQRLQAFGGVSIPTRTQLAGASPGATIAVDTPDHVLLHLDFGEAVFAQVVASFAVPGTLLPTLEIHCTNGSLSLPQPLPPNGQAHLFSGPLDAFLPDDRPAGLEGWMRDVASELRLTSVQELIGTGPQHFLRCLRGDEQPVLTAEHACHVLEIIESAQASIEQGSAIDLQTSFEGAPAPVASAAGER